MITKEETIKRFIIKKNMEIEKDLLKRIGGIVLTHIKHI